MEYTEIIERIDAMSKEDFTMDSFKNAGLIAKDIYHVYGRDLMNDKEDARAHFMAVREKLNCVVYEKLKEKLGFENETINTLMGFLDYFHQITDVYILDGNVIIQLMARDNKTVSYVIADGLYEVSSKDFVEGLDYNIYKCFFTDAMNNAMAPIFKEKLEKSKLLKLNDDIQINYNIDNLNIYTDKPLKKIMQINTDVTKEVAKVLIKHNNDELYYYDLKVHYAYFELARNDYKVNKLSEILKEKDKVKVKK